MLREAVGAIVVKDDKFLLVHKVKINGTKGKIDFEGSWDFVKGKIELIDKDKKAAVMRELLEETGSNEYKVLEEYSEQLKFEFDPETSRIINYTSQVTTLFLVEYLGNMDELKPQDDEIGEISFFDLSELLNTLSHSETKEFFIRNYMKSNN